MELHLIKGEPLVHSGDNLIVSHISLEVIDIDRVPGILDQLQWPYQQNVSVPKGSRQLGSGTNATVDGPIVKQYFLRDPDGYYLEVCNCDVLEPYVHAQRQALALEAAEIASLLGVSTGIVEAA